MTKCQNGTTQPNHKPIPKSRSYLPANTYLPRKFKIGIALPEDNCIDVYTQDVGLLAIVEAGQLVGYNVLVGGGLGQYTQCKRDVSTPRRPAGVRVL